MTRYQWLTYLAAGIPRPFLFFREHDVLLTTATPITYVNNGKYDIHGLALLRLLFMLDCYSFEEEHLEALPKSGWKDAQQGRQPYRDVWLSTEAEGAEGASKDPNIMPFLSLSTETVRCKRFPVVSQHQTSKKRQD